MPRPERPAPMMIRGVSGRSVISEVGRGETFKARRGYEMVSQSDRVFLALPLFKYLLRCEFALSASSAQSLHDALFGLAHYSSDIDGIEVVRTGDIVGWESASSTLGGSRQRVDASRYSGYSAMDSLFRKR